MIEILFSDLDHLDLEVYFPTSNKKYFLTKLNILQNIANIANIVLSIAQIKLILKNLKIGDCQLLFITLEV